MNILIYELNHYEIANVLLRLYDDMQYNITLITTDELLPFIEKYKNIQVHTVEKLSIVSFVKLCYHLKKFDVLIVGSIAYNFLLHYIFFETIKVRRKLLFIHDINSFFITKSNNTIKEKVNFLGKRYFIKNRNWQFNLLYNGLNSSILKYGNLHKILNIPGGLFQPSESKFKDWSEKITIVIPGGVSNKRRDYSLVYNVIQLLTRCNPGQFQFILLGENQLEGKLRAQFKLLSEKDETIKMFASNVDKITFQKYCEDAHLFLFPTVGTFQMNKNSPIEIYGETKASGNLGDAIKYAKPFFFPSYLKIPDELKTSAIAFENAEDFIKKANQLNSSEYKKLSQFALENSHKFSVENIRQYLRDNGLM